MLPILFDEFDAIKKYKDATTDAERAHIVGFLSESWRSQKISMSLGIENKYLLSYLKRAGNVLSEEELELWQRNAHVVTLGHIRALLGYDSNTRDKILRDIISKRMSVREVESLKHPSKKAKSSDLLDFENKLSQAAGAPVEIQYDPLTHSGKLIIDFYSLEELEDKAEKLGYRSSEW